MNVILQTKHTRLLQEDWSVLENDQAWISDSILSFWLEHLEILYSDPICPKIICFDPSTVFWILCETMMTDLQEGIAPLQLYTKDIAIIPINNSKDIQSSCSGTHWSLLVYVRKRLSETPSQFYHINSLPSTTTIGNRLNAQCVASKLHLFFENPFISIEEDVTSLRHIDMPDTIQVIDVSGSLQSNPNSCGIWVLFFAEIVAKSAVTQQQFIHECLQITEEMVNNKRIQIKNDIITRINKCHV